ncbi:putative cupredoxin-like copper-binding protein [Amorphus suaedae]
MTIKVLAVCAMAVAIASTPALAAGKHAGGHDDEMAIGKPGAAADATRTIRVRMDETDSGMMIFEPSKIEIQKGETIRFEVTNAGELEHEFVMDAPDANEKHKAVMARFPEMEHADPNAIRLTPGADGEIVWTFTEAGTFEFACLIPGHYESGMHGPLVVTTP